MGARTKLNQAYINGAILLAGIVAAVFESWTMFVILGLAFMVGAFVAGDIRIKPRR